MLDYQIQSLTVREFEALYFDYYPPLLAYAKSFVEIEDAEEIVQDVMVWLWENKKTAVITTSLKNYLFRSIRNNCLTQITQGKTKQRLRQQIYERLLSIQEGYDFYDIEELSAKIEESLNALPENYRTAFIKNRFENKTYVEIAAELNVSPKTIDYRICQALKLLRIGLKDFLPLLF